VKSSHQLTPPPRRPNDYCVPPACSWSWQGPWSRRSWCWGVVMAESDHYPAPLRCGSCPGLGGFPSVANHKAIPLLWGRHSHRLRSDDQPWCRRRRNRQLMEECRSNLFSQRVWVNLMRNGGDEGIGPVTAGKMEIATVHKVQLSRRQRRIRAKPSTRSGASVQRVHLKSKVQVSTSGLQREIRIGWSNIEEALLSCSAGDNYMEFIIKPGQYGSPGCLPRNQRA